MVHRIQRSRIGEAVFTNAHLDVTPAGGSYRSALTFTGSGFAPNESVRVYTSGVGSAVLASATADAAGSFSATASAPQSVNGPRIFVSVGESSGMLGAASFWMEARLILSPNSGSVGSTVTAAGYGFASRDWSTSSGTTRVLCWAPCRRVLTARSTGARRSHSQCQPGPRTARMGSSGTPGLRRLGEAGSGCSDLVAV